MIMFIIIFILILFSLYLLALFPNISRKHLMKPYEEKYIAHRGLFNNVDVPENSISAFKKAVENDYGIELDIQLTKDDKLVVFHDTSLERMTGIKKDLIDCTYDELLEYRLLETDETIPLFKDVLNVLEKDTPLIVEIKPDGRYIETTKTTVEILKDYDGLYNIESFNPYVVYYLKKNEPQIVRGQLAYNYLKNKDSKLNIFLKFILTYLLFNFINRPDYIAYEHINANNLSFKIVSRIYHCECVAWTIKSKQELKKARQYYQCFIFDSFIPDSD